MKLFKMLGLGLIAATICCALIDIFSEKVVIIGLFTTIFLIQLEKK